MTDTACRRARADNPLRLAYAARLLTTPDLAMPGTRVPEPAVLAGHVLFVPVPGATVERCEAVKAYAEQERLDLVLVDRAALPGAGSGERRFTFALGIAFYGHRLWRYGCRLWRPEGATPACFVPTAGDIAMFYRVQGGRLFGHEGRPWRDHLDEERGYDAAQRGLARLVEGR